MNKVENELAIVSVAVLSAVFSSGAAVRLPHVFGHNMVLQQGRHVPVWGKASTGESVTVCIVGEQRRKVNEH